MPKKKFEIYMHFLIVIFQKFTFLRYDNISPDVRCVKIYNYNSEISDKSVTIHRIKLTAKRSLSIHRPNKNLPLLFAPVLAHLRSMLFPIPKYSDEWLYENYH